jgi:hypothetical protein
MKMILIDKMLKCRKEKKVNKNMENFLRFAGVFMVDFWSFEDFQRLMATASRGSGWKVSHKKASLESRPG